MNTTKTTSISDLIQEYCTPTKERNKYQCPCCGGNNLSINPRTEKYNCWNCGDTKGIAKEVYRMAGLTKPIKYTPGKKFSYRYKDNKGKYLLLVTKVYKENGKKDIRQFTRDSYDNWIPGYNGQDIEQKCSLYRWDEIKDQFNVHIVEGEGVVDALMKNGIPATTKFRGSNGKFSELNQRQLKLLKQPIICPDRDEPGVKFANEVSEILDEGGIEYSWCHPFPDNYAWKHLPPSDGYDLEDWLMENESIPDKFYSRERIHSLPLQNEPKAAEEISIKEAPAKIRELYLTRVEPDLTIELYELGRKTGLHPLEWGKLVKSTQNELTKERANAGIANDFKMLVAEKDFIKHLLLKNQIKQKYNLSERQTESLFAHFSASSTIAKPSVFNLLEFLEKDLDAGCILFPGVPSTGVTLLGGSYGAGKTLFALALARAVTDSEVELFGEKATRNGPALIVSSDEGDADTQDKLITLGFSEEKSELILDWNIQHWELLEETVEKLKPAVIVIDSFAGIHSRGFDENTADAAATIHDLTRLSQRHGCAIILLHHLSKEGKFRGSTAIPAACAATLMLSGKEDEPRVLKSDKCRIQGGRIDVFYKLDDNFWPTKLSGGAEFSSTEISEQILDFLGDNKCGEIDEISLVLGEKKDTIRKSLNRLKSRGFVKCWPGKNDKRRRIWVLKNIGHENEKYRTQDDLYNGTQKNSGQPKTFLESESGAAESEKLADSNEGVSANFCKPEDLPGEDCSKISGQDRRGGGDLLGENLETSPPGVSANFDESNTEKGIKPKKNSGQPSKPSRIPQTIPKSRVGQKVNEKDFIRHKARLIYLSEGEYFACKFVTRSSRKGILIISLNGREIMACYDDLFYFK